MAGLDSFIPNLERLKGVGFGRDIETIDDKPVETIPGVVGPEFSEDTGYDPETASSGARAFLNTAVSAPDAEAQDLPAEDAVKADVLTLGSRSANAIVDVPASDFNVSTIPLADNVSVKLVDANLDRLAITIYNPPGAGTVFVGNNAAVNLGFSSFPIIAGNSLTMAVSSEIWVAADAEGQCAYIEYLM